MMIVRGTPFTCLFCLRTFNESGTFEVRRRHTTIDNDDTFFDGADLRKKVRNGVTRVTS